jgi:D-lactate dehydrogenase (cytochrome)
VKALHIDHMDVVVEPGIGWMEPNRFLEPHGLFSPLDPGKFREHVPGMPFFLVPLCVKCVVQL